MVNCHLCKEPIKVSSEKHYYDEKLKKRYHMRCFAGICPVCDKPVGKKAKHKTIGTNVWHTDCYKRKHGSRKNPKEDIIAVDGDKVPIIFWTEIEGGIHSQEGDLIFIRDTPHNREVVKKHGVRAYDTHRVGDWSKKNPEEDIIAVDGDKVPIIFWTEIEGGIHSQEGDLIFIRDTPHNREVVKKHGVRAYDTHRVGDWSKKNPEGTIETIDKKSWKAMETARKAAKTPKGERRAFEEQYWVKHPPSFEKERKNPSPSPIERYLATGQPSGELEENPLLVTPTEELKIQDAYRRVRRGQATKEDQQLVREAREQGVILSTGPNIMFKRPVPLTSRAQTNPAQKERGYTIVDQVGAEYARGKGTEEHARAVALLLGKKYERELMARFD